MIGLWVESEHAELKSVLSFGLAMTTAKITTRLGEHGNDLARERNRAWMIEPRDFHTHAEHVSFIFHYDRRLPILDRTHQTEFIDRCNMRVLTVIVSRSSDIDHAAIFGYRVGKELLRGFGLVENHPKWRNFQRSCDCHGGKEYR